MSVPSPGPSSGLYQASISGRSTRAAPRIQLGIFPFSDMCLLLWATFDGWSRPPKTRDPVRGNLVQQRREPHDFDHPNTRTAVRAGGGLTIWKVLVFIGAAPSAQALE